MYAYIGNADNNGLGGISLTSYSKTDSFKLHKTFYKDVNASRLIINKEKHLLFCVDERITISNEYGGRVYSFRICENGELKIINYKRLYSSLPCYIAFDDDYSHIIVCNYCVKNKNTIENLSDVENELLLKDEACVFTLPIEQNGALGEIQDRWNYSMEVTDKFASSHFHCVHRINKMGNYYMVTDFGANMVHLLEINYGKIRYLKSIQLTMENMRPRYVLSSFNGLKVWVNGEGTNNIVEFDCKELPLLEYHGKIIDENHEALPGYKQADIGGIIINGRELVYCLTREDNSICVLLVGINGDIVSVIQKVMLNHYRPKGICVDEMNKCVFVLCSLSHRILFFEITEEGLLGTAFEYDTGLYSPHHMVV